MYLFIHEDGMLLQRESFDDDDTEMVLQGSLDIVCWNADLKKFESMQVEQTEIEPEGEEGDIEPEIELELDVSWEVIR